MSEAKLPLLLAVDALSISSSYQPGHGWRLQVRVRRNCQSWAEGTQDVYEGLTTAELEDALDAAVRAILDPEGP